MRLVLLFALLALPAGRAVAADAHGAGAGADVPICTTTTVVVKRGDVVLSTASKTRCQKVPAATAGGGFHPEAVFKASDILSSFSFGGGETLSPRNAPANWRVIDERSGDICHLVLKERPGPSGLPAVSEGCRGALARAATWSFQDGAVDVLAADGARIVRLQGDRRQLSGQTADGHQLQLQR